MGLDPTAEIKSAYRVGEVESFIYMWIGKIAIADIAIGDRLSEDTMGEVIYDISDAFGTVDAGAWNGQLRLNRCFAIGGDMGVVAFV